MKFMIKALLLLMKFMDLKKGHCFPRFSPEPLLEMAVVLRDECTVFRICKAV